MNTVEEIHHQFQTVAADNVRVLENYSRFQENESWSKDLKKDEAGVSNYAALMLIPLIAAIALGNIMVILLVTVDRRLRSATNCFLSSLAVADMLVALTVMPPSLAMIVNNYTWPFSDIVCGLWVMLDVFFSTSSILHLCMISCDRYLALAQPFSRRRAPTTSFGASGKLGCQSMVGQSGSKNWKPVARRIFAVWSISLGIAVPIPIMGSIDRDNLFAGDMCAINMAAFQIFGSLAAFFLPLIIMFIMYTLTVRTLNRQARLVSNIMVQSGRSSPPLRSSFGDLRSSRRYEETASNRSDFQSASDRELTAAPNRRCSTCLRRKEEQSPLRSWWKAVRPLGRALRRLRRLKLLARRTDDIRNRTANDDSERNNPRCTCRRDDKSAEENVRRLQRQSRRSRDNHGRVSSSFKNQAMASINNEQRASKVLGLIFVLFCVFWCPFFITNVTSRLCTTCDQELMGNLMNWFVWVGYVSSGVNPCVYTMFSERFRQSFLLFIRCRIEEMSEKRRRRRSGGSTSFRSNSLITRSSRASLTSATTRSSSLTSFPAGSDVDMTLLSKPVSDEKWRKNVEAAKSYFHFKHERKAPSSDDDANRRSAKHWRWSMDDKPPTINRIREDEEET